MEERRERNADTGENIDVSTGAGFGDVFAKLTGKTAKTLAIKAAEKVIEKGAEKTGEVLGEKIYDNFSSKKKPSETKGEEIANYLKKEYAKFEKIKETTQPSETKGEEVVAILKQEDNPKVDKYQYIKDVYDDLL